MAFDGAAWPGSIFAVTIFADDLAATKAFYTKVFGLPAMFEDDTSAVFKFGELMINVLEISSAPELINPAKVASADAGSRSVISLPVEDVDATVAELTSRGVTWINGPMERPWGIRTASFKDPSGQIWEIAK